MGALLVCLSLLSQAPAAPPAPWKWADARAPREAWLDVQALLRDDLPRVRDVLQQGIASAEHAAFVASLQPPTAPQS